MLPHARKFRSVALALAAAMLLQGGLGGVHSHSLNARDAASVEEHTSGHCGHGPEQSHNDPIADHCSICLAVLSPRSNVAVDAAPLLVFDQPVGPAPTYQPELGGISKFRPRIRVPA